MVGINFKKKTQKLIVQAFICKKTLVTLDMANIIFYVNIFWKNNFIDDPKVQATASLASFGAVPFSLKHFRSQFNLLCFRVPRNSSKY